METEADKLRRFFKEAHEANKYGSYARRKDYYDTKMMMEDKIMTQHEINTIDNFFAGVKGKQYIVGSFSAGGISFSATPVLHPDAVSARKECKRLAAMNPGKAYLFVQLSGAELVPTTPVISI
jgi:hypothetical protein